MVDLPMSKLLTYPLEHEIRGHRLIQALYGLMEHHAQSWYGWIIDRHWQRAVEASHSNHSDDQPFLTLAINTVRFRVRRNVRTSSNAQWQNHPCVCEDCRSRRVVFQHVIGRLNWHLEGQLGVCGQTSYEKQCVFPSLLSGPRLSRRSEPLSY